MNRKVHRGSDLVCHCDDRLRDGVRDMISELALVLVLLAAAIVMFAINKPRLDAVALIMLVALPFTGVLTMGEALAGFSDPNIVLIAALFVIGDGLVRTGVAQRLGDWLIAKAGKNEVRLTVLLMVVVCSLGATMSSTAVTAIFIPVALRIAQSTGVGPGRLMMPLSFAALISGMTTLVATAPNLVVNSELERHGLPGFAFFSFTPFGLPVLALGILYMSFVRRWLPAGSEAMGAGRTGLAAWVDEYQLADHERRLRVTEGSPLVGQTLANLDLRGSAGINIIAVEKSGRFAVEVIRPTAATELSTGDTLLIDVSSPSLEMGAVQGEICPAGITSDRRIFCRPFTGYRHGRSDCAADVGAYRQVCRRGGYPHRARPHRDRLAARRRSAYKDPTNREAQGRRHAAFDWPLGGHREISYGNQGSRDHPIARRGRTSPARALAKSLQAVACLLLVVGLMVSGLVPNVQAALIGCLLMGVLGCVDFASAYRSVDWKTIVLIVGMLPFSIALERTGGVDLAAAGLKSLTLGSPPVIVLATLFAITALLGMFISNTATAVLMAPVALAVAKEMGVSPYPFAMIVALAASTAFMTPVSSPVNTLVVGPGRYTFGDFVRIGVPFSLVVLVVSVILVPWLLPL